MTPGMTLALALTAVPGLPKPNLGTPIIQAIRTTPPRGGVSTSYTSGPISYDVQIENPTSERLQTNLRVSSLASAGNMSAPAWWLDAKVPVVIEPNASRWITFEHAGGLGNGGCDSFMLRLEVEGGRKRDVVTTPTCTFSQGGVVETDAADPAKRTAARAGKLFITAAKVTASPQCEEPLTIDVSVKNLANQPAEEVFVHLVGPLNDPNIEKKVGPFNVAKGGHQIVTKPIASGIRGQIGKYELWLSQSTVFLEVYNPGWYVEVKQKCSLAVKLQLPTTKYATMDDLPDP